MKTTKKAFRIVRTLNSITNNRITRAIGNAARKLRNLMPFAMLILLHHTASAQNLVNSDLSNFDHSLSTVSINEDTLKVSFLLGSAANPGTDVAGYDITVEFPNLLSGIEGLFVSIDGSWVGNSVEGSLSTSYDDAADALTFEYLRSDELGQNGQGTIATLHLIRAAGFEPSEASAQTEGGIVMVENIEFKWSGDAGLEDDNHIPATIYPNPATDRFHVQLDDPQQSEVRLYAPNGSLIRTQKGDGFHTFDVANLAAGLYIVELRTKKAVSRERVVVEPAN